MPSQVGQQRSHYPCSQRLIGNAARESDQELGTGSQIGALTCQPAATVIVQAGMPRPTAGLPICKKCGS